MGYELIWQPYKQGWAVWSTVVDAFMQEDIQTPEGVVDYILGSKEYYYQRDTAGNIRYEKNIDGELVASIATCQYHSRMDIVNHYTQMLSDAKELSIHILTEHGWEEEVIPAEQVRDNIEKAYIHAIQEWEAGRIFPDPKAKEEVRKYWLDEAERVKREGIMTISGLTFQIADEGLEYKGKVTKGPEVW